MIILFPGDVGPLVSLVECLRQRHDADRDFIAREVKAREAKGVPLDGLADPGEFDEGACAPFARVTVRFRALTESKRRRMLFAVDETWREFSTATGLEREDARDRLQTARAEFVSAAVADIVGLTRYVEHDAPRPFQADTSDDEDLEGIVASGLIDPLFLAARHFGGLVPGEAVRFGLSQPST